jgi:hypothetical protein
VRPVDLSPEAEIDVERLHDFLFEKNPRAAVRLVAPRDCVTIIRIWHGLEQR